MFIFFVVFALVHADGIRLLINYNYRGDAVLVAPFLQNLYTPSFPDIVHWADCDGDFNASGARIRCTKTDRGRLGYMPLAIQIREDIAAGVLPGLGYLYTMDDMLMNPSLMLRTIDGGNLILHTPIFTNHEGWWRITQGVETLSCFLGAPARKFNSMGDLFYIPTKRASLFADLAMRMGDCGVFLECAVPRLVSIISRASDVGLHNATLAQLLPDPATSGEIEPVFRWDKNRTEVVSFLTNSDFTHTIGVHPIKISTVLARPDALTLIQRLVASV